jgi:hypothetical protein
MALGMGLAYAALVLLRAFLGSSSATLAGRTEQRSRRDRIEEALLWSTIAVLGVAFALCLAWFASIGFGVVGFDRDRDVLFRLCLS